jgi:hypothetical protein
VNGWPTKVCDARHSHFFFAPNMQLTLLQSLSNSESLAACSRLSRKWIQLGVPPSATSRPVLTCLLDRKKLPYRPNITTRTNAAQRRLHLDRSEPQPNAASCSHLRKAHPDLGRWQSARHFSLPHGPFHISSFHPLHSSSSLRPELLARQALRLPSALRDRDQEHVQANVPLLRTLVLAALACFLGPELLPRAQHLLRTLH